MKAPKMLSGLTKSSVSGLSGWIVSNQAERGPKTTRMESDDFNSLASLSAGGVVSSYEWKLGCTAIWMRCP
jgi:hypothetical protein